MYVNCFPLHFCCLQSVTKAMLLYNSAICDLLRESIQIMKIPIHVKVVKWCRKEWNEHNLMYIYHKQCEIMQKSQWNSSKANITDFPLTDGAAVEQQCLCKLLEKKKCLKTAVKVAKKVTIFGENIHLEKFHPYKDSCISNIKCINFHFHAEEIWGYYQSGFPIYWWKITHNLQKQNK